MNNTQIADVLCLHPSVSSQHAVIQFRRVKGMIKPYIMDLKSRHGTYLMGDRIQSHRYYELLPKDVIKFGVSTRQYIVLAEDSNTKDVTDKSEIQINDNQEDNKNDIDKQETYTIWSDDDDD